ncbi:hypothetical protein PT2222_310023 [Paraburkholderia tropica]
MIRRRLRQKTGSTAGRAVPRRPSTARLAGKRLAESERNRRAGVVARDVRVVGDVLAHGVGQLRGARIRRQAEVLADARTGRAADRVDGVEDAVGGTFDIRRARTARGHVGLRAKAVEVACGECESRERQNERAGAEQSPQHGSP